MIIDLVQQYDIGSRCMVSSFSPDTCKTLNDLKVANNLSIPKLNALKNRGGLEEPKGLSGYEILYDGINVAAAHLKKEVIEMCIAKGKTIGVWKMGNGDETENEDFYKETWHDGTIDYFFSDQPLRAMESRTKFYSE